MAVGSHHDGSSCTYRSDNNSKNDERDHHRDTTQSNAICFITQASSPPPTPAMAETPYSAPLLPPRHRTPVNDLTGVVEIGSRQNNQLCQVSA